MKKLFFITVVTIIISCKEKVGKTLSEEENTVKVGILHSLTGTMGIPETDCKNASMLPLKKLTFLFLI